MIFYKCILKWSLFLSQVNIVFIAIIEVNFQRKKIIK